MRRLLLVLAAASAAPASAQVRQWPQDRFDDILLLQQIVRAYLDNIDVDDPDERARFFPGRELADFDRNRNGQFMTAGDGFGTLDVDLAILQFIHDGFDADGDELRGFVELECPFAGGPVLDPDRARTRDGILDHQRDCDGDGVDNLTEQRVATNPLDPASVCAPLPEACDGRDNDCDGLADEGIPEQGGACDRRGEIFLQELVTYDPLFGFAITITEVVGWMRGYRIAPEDRPMMAEAEDCRLYDANAAADPGDFVSLRAGNIAVRGGVENFTLSYDPVSANYGDPSPPIDLWEPGQRIELSAPGATVGPFTEALTAPASVDLFGPDDGGMSRADPTVTWAPGPDVNTPVEIRIRTSNRDGSWELYCVSPDTGEATLPEAAMDWIPADTRPLTMTVTRTVSRTFVTAHPAAALTVHLDARYSGPRVPVLP